MHHFICDMCGKGLLVDEDVRYEITIEVKSAYDPMEITDEDLKKDHETEIQRLMKKMAGMEPQDLEDEVYKLFKFDLCRTCQIVRLLEQSELSRDPVGGLGTRTPEGQPTIVGSIPLKRNCHTNKFFRNPLLKAR